MRSLLLDLYIESCLLEHNIAGAMDLDQHAVSITVYPPSMQGRGAFDGGKITERKPIGFPGDDSEIKRVGPLFYWAWATSHAPSKIALHPHQAFEIVSYVLEGEIGHYDTLGTKSRVGEGGTQVMQTGWGISHEEEMPEAGTEFFQIWFEPYLQEALRRAPTYAAYHHDDFPTEETDDLTIKSVIGDDAPIRLVADATMQDLTLASGRRYRRFLSAGRCLAVVAIRGAGAWHIDEKTQALPFDAGAFSVVCAELDASIEVTAEGEGPLRLAVIEVPSTVKYPLYPK
ncbi:MAG: pirin family protein [Rhodothermales bacterium]